MSDTKQKIIQAAADLFHDQGVAPVRLQQIADRAEVSVGNLAYHFKNKEAIIQAVYDQLSQRVKDILQQFRQLPTLLDLDRQLSQWFAFNDSYTFYFSAYLPASVPEVAQQRARLISRLTSQLTKRIEYHVQRGVMHPPEETRPYAAMVDTTALIITSWSFYQGVKGEADAELIKFKALVWAQFFPHFTPRGQAEYHELIQPMLTRPTQGPR